MAIDVTVPAVGESVTEGRIARWLKPSGSAVQADEPLFELETDKAAQEIVAPAAGVLTVTVKEGEVVKVGQKVGSIDPAGVATATAKPTTTPLPAKAEPVLSPAARAHVADNNLDAAKIPATGPGGRVTKEDVVAFQGQGAGGKGQGENGPAGELAPRPSPLAPSRAKPASR